MVVDIFVVFLLILIGIAVYAQSVYIQLIQTQETLNKSLKDIKSLEKQRFGEIPNLIKVCEDCMEHEHEVLDKMTQARSRFMEATTPEQMAWAGSKLTGAFKALFAVSEDYPGLKANTNFMQIQERIDNLEKQIVEQIELYNKTASIFNTRIKNTTAKYIVNITKCSCKEMYQMPEAKATTGSSEASDISFGKSA
jgi:LemA protein